MTAPTVLALGGGGFASPEGDPALDDLVLDLGAVAVPRILFLPTAGGDEPLQIARFQGVAYADGRGVVELAAQPLRRLGACARAPASADVRELRALRRAVPRR
ncbi:MAG TPA: hypothetical protein VLA98_11110 [Solirubrobacteraceae bacterium]|nr:hypothetical protein [Solirubrobacteraceae bacterium]